MLYKFLIKLRSCEQDGYFIKVKPYFIQMFLSILCWTRWSIIVQCISCKWLQFVCIYAKCTNFHSNYTCRFWHHSTKKSLDFNKYIFYIVIKHEMTDNVKHSLILSRKTWIYSLLHSWDCQTVNKFPSQKSSKQSSFITQIK